ncbi:MAG: ribosome recycling factor [Chlamydiales bacterium]|nr:ribosome recycling factor [Chlamydiales bacterium]
MSNVENQVKAAMQAAVDHLKQELKSLRTGRANASILDHVHVEVYGSKVNLKTLANINVPESRQIVVTPFDLTTVHAIAKGIEAANLGIHPMVDGKIVRINVPPMDQAIRKQIAKQCKELGEKAKIAMRDIRRKFNELVRKQKTSGEITEDQMKKAEKTIQELTDRYCKDCDTVCAEKEKDIMTV